MKNKPQVMDQRNQTKMMDWLYQDTQEDDFLLGKTPNELQYTWDDEE